VTPASATASARRFFGIDLGVGKRFNLFTLKDQPHTIQFRAESFNVQMPYVSIRTLRVPAF